MARIHPSVCALIATAGLAALVSACSVAPPAAPTATEVTALEARLRQDPADLRTRSQLAAAYRDAGRAEEAANVLERAAGTFEDPGATYLLGLIYEDLGRFADARRQYEAVLRAPGGVQRSQVRNRLALVQRKELHDVARAAIAREAELADAAPAPRSVAVFPFIVTAHEEIAPLGRALAELLTADLAVSSRLTVLERARLQILLDEIQLGESAYSDPATAARAGRMLGAGRIVQGSIQGDQNNLGIQALVVAVPQAEVPGAPLTQRGSLDQLFELEANLALEIFRSLGIELTVAERERVLQQPTQNIQALLAFGFGLEAMDAGRWAEAASHFARATRLDPGFRDARDRLTEMQALNAAATTTIQHLARLALGNVAPDLSPWQRERLRFMDLDAMVPAALTRDPSAELLGTEGLQRGPTLEIIIRRPGGGS